MARIMRRCKTHQKNFSVKRYGGWRAARKAGAKWIDQKKKTLPSSRMNEMGRMTAKNRSGVVGVSLSKRIVRKDSGWEYTYWSWVAKWPTGSSKGGFRWSISENLSDDDAFALAVLSRQMECEDRDKVRAKLSRIYGRASHIKIMEKKRQQA